MRLNTKDIKAVLAAAYALMKRTDLTLAQRTNLHTIDGLLIRGLTHHDDRAFQRAMRMMIVLMDELPPLTTTPLAERD